METSVNNKCKAFTSLEQSRKLAEILPLESADMFYTTNYNLEGKVIGLLDVPLYIGSDGFIDTEMGEIYAWSLAALLNVIPSGQVNRMANSDKWEASSWNDSDFEPSYYVEDYDNPVDACVAMVEKLKELNLL